ncbi:MAG: glycosyl hydrolase [Chitinophagaceae bacterium]|nr:MAG: glycosyl hydrolase [Chitinophagaceae bacterium]
MIRESVKGFGLSVVVLLLALAGKGQKVYFVDGFHGGVYGHYPKQYTAFINEMLAKYPDWRISLEIEPETWDSVQRNEPGNYETFRTYLADQSDRGRVEYVNPSYGQPYFYNINGESIIRQFAYGIRKMKQHFPELRYSTYSSEEPCFTSALPQVLLSFGFKNASLKNPNTCWGGYTRAFGGEMINWVGPDGSKLPTVPRYASEALDPKSTWQTTASTNSPDYIRTAFASGIKNPVGMCLQDAGWKFGPWLRKETGQQSIYTTWRNYISNVAAKGPLGDWKFSQEDVQVSLVWGAQVLQQIAREVRFSENSLGRAEKLAALSLLEKNNPFPSAALDEGWRQLMLAQHHDCWIVPYNGKKNHTWIDRVTEWTGFADSIAAAANSNSFRALFPDEGPQTSLQLFNANAGMYKGMVSMLIPSSIAASGFDLLSPSGKSVPYQLQNDRIHFGAEVPGMGTNTYRLVPGKSNPINGSMISHDSTGLVVLETDLYRIGIDPAAGGAIVSLVAKKMGNREFVDRSAGKGLNMMEGYFFRDSSRMSSAASHATILVREDGPLAAAIEVNGKIGIHPYTQRISVTKTGELVDVSLRIDWQGNPGIGDGYKQAGGYKAEDYRKAFYDDSKKLQTLFPLNLEKQRLSKNAPFDVTESTLGNTVFRTWDSIKHNVLLNWIDITDEKKQYGLAVFSDHTTSYLHAGGLAGLTTQYSGVGLWGRNYSITGPTEFSYALYPHKGDWEQASVWRKNTEWNNPPETSVSHQGGIGSTQLLRSGNPDIEITAVEMQDGNMIVRLFNPSRKTAVTTLLPSFTATRIETVELDGRVKKSFGAGKSGKTLKTSLPAFGFETILFTGVKK